MICTQQDIQRSPGDLAELCKCDSLNYKHQWHVIIREATFEEYWNYGDHAKICLEQAPKKLWQARALFDKHKFYEVSDDYLHINEQPVVAQA